MVIDNNGSTHFDRDTELPSFEHAGNSSIVKGNPAQMRRASYDFPRDIGLLLLGRKSFDDFGKNVSS